MRVALHSYVSPLIILYSSQDMIDFVAASVLVKVESFGLASHRLYACELHRATLNGVARRYPQPLVPGDVTGCLRGVSLPLSWSVIPGATVHDALKLSGSRSASCSTSWPSALSGWHLPRLNGQPLA